MSFLPKDYELPDSPSRYMRLEEGKNKFRIVSSAITGWEWWVDTDEGGRKPMRVKTRNDVPKTVDKVKHFWAFVVWDYGDKTFKVMEVTQKTIMGSINALVSDEAWGNPQEYDLVITRSGKDLDTVYTVMPNPKSEFKEDTAELANIRLEALYDGDNPFMDENVDSKEVFDGSV